MSDLTEIQARVLTIFGDTAQAQITNADILRWANDGQIDIAKKTEVLWTSVLKNGVQGTVAYTVGTDYLFIRQVLVNGYLVTRSSMAQLNDMYPERNVSPLPTGQPRYYYMGANGSLNLFPAPDANGVNNIQIDYVKRPAALVQATQETLDVPVVFLEDIVRYCLMRAKELDEDWNAAMYFKKDYADRAMESQYETQVQFVDSYPAIRMAAGEDW